jgi:hypothetical protein
VLAVVGQTVVIVRTEVPLEVFPLNEIEAGLNEKPAPDGKPEMMLRAALAPPLLPRVTVTVYVALPPATTGLGD